MKDFSSDFAKFIIFLAFSAFYTKIRCVFCKKDIDFIHFASCDRLNRRIIVFSLDKICSMLYNKM